MSIIKSAVNKPVTTALVFVAFLILGLFSLMNIPVDLMPDFDANTIMVVSSYPGVNASDIETNLTKVLENSLNGVEDLKKISSQSKENISIITLEFEYGTDIEEATNNVRDNLDMVSMALPDGASTPVIFKFSADALPIMMFTASATESASGLEKILDEQVTTPLVRVKGVGTVSVSGAPTREIQVYCDPNKLDAYHLTIPVIAQIIAAENRNLPSGNIDIGSSTYTLRIEKEFKDPSELLDIVVGSYNGKTILLRDVATVRDGSEEREQESYTNGRRSARIIVQKQSGANTVNVSRGVHKQLEQARKTLPSDIEITQIFDSSEDILNTIHSLLETILITFLVVMLVVFLFLGRWRPTFIIVLSIPVALLASLVYLYATGNSLNIISMASLSIAIGMVVDDAIVVIENVTTHLERGEKPKEAAIHGTSEVGISVIASTLTMLAVFLPLTLIKGMTGIMFKQLGWIVSIIMIVSTTAALTLVPMLCSQFMRVNKSDGKLYKLFFTPIDKALDGISVAYSKLINWAVTHRKTVIFGAFGIFVAVLVFLGPGVKTEFFPRTDQDRITLNLSLPMGTAQPVSAEVARSIYDDIVAEIPEVQRINYTFGQADSDNLFASMQANGTHIISMTVRIGSKSERKRSSMEIADQIRGILRRYPELRKATVTEGGGGMGMGGGSSVALEIYGYDFDETDAAAKAIQAKMLERREFAQVILSRDEYTPEYQVDFDREKLALNGLNSTTAGAAFSAAMSGTVASLYREDGDEYNIRVRYAPEFRTSIEDMENIIIYNPAGRAIRLKELGNVVETEVPPTIERRNRQRYITVTGLVANKVALSEAVAVTNEIVDETSMPSDLYCVIGGDYEEQQKMFGDMIVLMLLMVILVYIVMAAQFESFINPFVIMFSLPFAAVGVILGLWATNTALSAMGMVGIIILIGIVVKNGIVLIDYTILCRERGMNVIEASVAAARSRLRPILMTTLTTVLGMIPLAVGRGEGAEMWNGLGMVVAWGLTISTLVTLVLIPTVYCVFASRQERRATKKYEIQ